MQMISAMTPGAAQMPAGVEKTPQARQPEEETKARPATPRMDEYTPEEKGEPTGRYWIEKDENGKPVIHVDDPEKAADGAREADRTPDAEKSERDGAADGSEKKASAEGGETCTCSTDKVDREIAELKKKKQDLERRLGSETDEKKIEKMEKELAEVKRELQQKDNDTYRRQHAEYTFL